MYDIPLLVEGGSRWRARLDRVPVLDCPPEVQMARVMARSGLARGEIESILAAQAARAQRLAAADWVLFNGETVTVPELQAQIDALARRMGL